jgi:hypothetical protein
MPAQRTHHDELDDRAPTMASASTQEGGSRDHPGHDPSPGCGGDIVYAAKTAVYQALSADDFR